jgi:phosphoglycerate dehydrogenase-like enzyme
MERLVLAPHSRTIDQIFWPEDLEKLRTIVDLVWAKDDPLPAGEGSALKRDASFFACSKWSFGSIDAAEAPRLRAVFELGGGHWATGAFDYETAFRRGIRAMSCAPAFAPWVAELTLGVMINAARDLSASDRDIRAGRETFGKMEVGTLIGARVGIIGYGNLARALHPLLTPFGCSIQAYDPWLPADSLLEQHVTPTDLESLLETSDFVVVLATPSASNRGLLTRERLMRVKQGAVVALISRAHLLDFPALLELSSAGRFKVAIDVYPNEPPQQDDPVRSSQNSLLTAHLAGGNKHARRNIGRFLLRDIEAMAAGLPPSHMMAAQPEILKRREEKA